MKKLIAVFAFTLLGGFKPIHAQSLHVEASGLTEVADLDGFLVVSDDTPDDRAQLFRVDRDGKLDAAALSIPGISKISDLESISQDGEFLYVLASQSLNKKGKDKKERNLFVRFKRQGRILSGTESVELKPLLLQALEESPDPKLAPISVAISDGDFEIESHFVDAGNLYLGFKAPLIDREDNILLKIADVEALFKTKHIAQKDISLRGLIDFGAVEGAPHRLSDLALIHGEIFASTVCKNEDCGRIWRLREKNGQFEPELLAEYPGLKPEGVAYDSKNSSLFICFDQKEKPSKFAQLPVVFHKKPAENARQ